MSIRVNEVERTSWRRVAVGVAVASLVPFFVTGFYRVTDLSPVVLYLALPFVLLTAITLSVWRRWRNVGVGILSGSLIYGVFLLVLLYSFGR